MYKRTGFTLIELLVVIAIIALLMGILMPALQIARKKAAGIVCSSRQKQLVLAWIMYADENNDKIVYSDTRIGTRSWVEPPQDESGSEVTQVGNMTLDDRKRGIMNGALFPYIKSIDFYHCPSDDRKKNAEGTAACAFRSYSITSGLNSITGATAPDHVPYRNRSDIKNAANALVFVEEAERERGFNHESWALWVQHPEFYDPLAVFHGESCTLGYADGHAQSYRFRTREVLEYFREGRKSFTVEPDNADYIFFRKCFPFKSFN
jgi:prepilin-type N-terminal cleavage/methylation domain-containing protein/prepilin-type processing-associated H-X9-DG protein